MSQKLQSYDVNILSAGDILRKNVRMGTPLGQKADKVIKEGSLLPDDVMLKLLTSELEKVHDYHWILDGFPRTIGQGQLLDNQLERDSINLVVNLDVPDSIILDRIQQRWIHEKSGRVYNLGYNPPKVAGRDDVTGEALTQRDDDNVDTFKTRLNTYRSHTEPLLEYYQSSNRLETVSGKTSDEIWPQLNNLIKNKFSFS